MIAFACLTYLSVHLYFEDRQYGDIRSTRKKFHVPASLATYYFECQDSVLGKPSVLISDRGVHADSRVLNDRSNELPARALSSYALLTMASPLKSDSNIGHEADQSATFQCTRSRTLTALQRSSTVRKVRHRRVPIRAKGSWKNGNQAESTFEALVQYAVGDIVSPIIRQS